ncbi:MAG: 2-hydroxychromene-2-carboxylate isomerase [Gammaproteobacteria bacterium]|nr:2-hydroxychromene-2-carboxylate isomerase [Gammaproteobacteria bacterium]
MKLEYHFDFASPNCYHSHKVIPAIEARTGASFDYFPILLGGVFKLTNNRSPMEQFAGVRNKSEYQARETARFLRKHGIAEFRRNPHFPVNTLYLMRGAVFARERDYFERYVEAVFACMWEREMNMADPAVIAEGLGDAGLPADEIIAGSQDPAVKQKLIDNTSASVEHGCFGAPTFFVNDEMFFGKDRLRDVEEEIIATAGR